MKNKFFHVVLRHKVTIYSPKEILEEAGRFVKKNLSLYLHLCDVMEELEAVTKVENHPNMAILSVHIVKRVGTRAGFSCVSLYKILSDSNPCNQQLYRNGTDDPIGHFDLPS